MDIECKQQIQLKDSAVRVVHFELQPKVIVGETVSVSAEYPRQWKKDLKKFQKLFLGIRKNSIKCRILNPEVLSFNDEPPIFTATAIQPIQIENRALGYHLEYHLLDISFRENKFRRYIGETKYAPLTPKSSREQKRWVKNRIKAV